MTPSVEIAWILTRIDLGLKPVSIHFLVNRNIFQRNLKSFGSPNPSLKRALRGGKSPHPKPFHGL